MSLFSTIINILFGNENRTILYALIALVVLDYTTGICVAIRQRKLSSSIGSKGIVGKVMVFIMVSLSHIVDKYLLPSGAALESITILFYSTNEIISILENASKIGIPFPEKLVAHLKAFNDKQKKS
jgi:toxin secretion/phage lysis holin